MNYIHYIQKCVLGHACIREYKDSWNVPFLNHFDSSRAFISNQSCRITIKMQYVGMTTINTRTIIISMCILKPIVKTQNSMPYNKINQVAYRNTRKLWDGRTGHKRERQMGHFVPTYWANIRPAPYWSFLVASLRLRHGRNHLLNQQLLLLMLSDNLPLLQAQVPFKDLLTKLVCHSPIGCSLFIDCLRHHLG